MNALTAIIIFGGATVLWLRFFSRRDRGEPEPWRAVTRALLFGAVAALLAGFLNGGIAALLERRIPALAHFLSSGDAASLSSARVFAGFLPFAAIEELLKAAALLFAIRRLRAFGEASDGIFYGIAVGLGFAFLENLGYVAEFGAPSVAIRLVATITHPALTGCVGYTIGKYRILRTARRRTVGGVVGTMVLLHAFYNWTATLADGNAAIALLFFATIALLYGELLILYLQAQRFVRTIYCIRCGKPNHDANRFCTACGALLLR